MVMPVLVSPAMSLRMGLEIECLLVLHHREILAFSISHDDKSVRIYGHYPVIDGNETTFHRHAIGTFRFMDAKEKWATYKFTKNVYDVWVPSHFKRICSVVDELQVPGSFGPSHEVPGPSHEVQSHLSLVYSSDTIANTSVSQGTVVVFH